MSSGVYEPELNPNTVLFRCPLLMPQCTLGAEGVEDVHETRIRVLRPDEEELLFLTCARRICIGALPLGSVNWTGRDRARSIGTDVADAPPDIRTNTMGPLAVRGTHQSAPGFTPAVDFERLLAQDTR